MSAVVSPLLNSVAAPQRQPRRLSKTESSDLFYYFYKLDQRDPNRFEKMWDQIFYADLTPKNYALILYSIAKQIKNPNIDDDRRGKILSYVRSNFGAWETRALKKIDKFNAQELSMSAWAMAVLDRLYRRESLLETYQKLRPSIVNKKLCDAQDIQQVHDADIAFLGATKLPVPKRNGAPKRSFLERSLIYAFSDAGILVPQKPHDLIPEFPQAIDFIAEWKRKDIWNEVDGDTHFYDPGHPTFSRSLAYNTSTLFNSALLQIAAPNARILRIDFVTADHLIRAKPLEAKDKLRELLELISDAPAGVVHRSWLTPQQTVRIEPLVTPRN